MVGLGNNGQNLTQTPGPSLFQNLLQDLQSDSVTPAVRRDDHSEFRLKVRSGIQAKETNRFPCLLSGPTADIGILDQAPRPVG
jgi:hypothetical protein